MVLFVSCNFKISERTGLAQHSDNCDLLLGDLEPRSANFNLRRRDMANFVSEGE